MKMIKDLGEFGLIEHLTKNMKSYDAGVFLGIGDDAAAFKAGSGYMLATCDMLLEGRHFIFDRIPPCHLGYKALAVSISDIAAMGGIPRYGLISTGWPDYVSLAYAEEFYRGLKKAAAEYGVNILGGDTVKAPQLVIDVTIIGETLYLPLTRSGARPGDLITVTGRVGASAAGLQLLLTEKGRAAGEPVPPSARNYLFGGLSRNVYDDLVKAHHRPRPRVQEALTLVKMSLPTAAIDISDGVVSEITHICTGSNTGAEIYGDNLPIDSNTRLAAAALGVDPLDWALFGGEDYELIITLPGEKLEEARDALWAGAEAEMGMGMGMGTGTETKTGARTGSAAEAKTGAGAGAGASAGAGAAGSGAGSGAGEGAGEGAGAGSGASAGAGAGASAGAGAGTAKLTVIGKILPPDTGVSIIIGGEKKPLTEKGYDHFRTGHGDG